MTLSCDLARSHVDAMRGLSAADRAALAAHVAECDACRAFATLEARIAPAFARTPSLTPSPRLTAALLAVPTEQSRRRVFVYAPLAWGTLAAVALIAVVTWVARTPGTVVQRPSGGGGTAPTVETGRPVVPAVGLAVPRPDVDPSATAGAARRATPTPTGPLAAAVALLRPAAASPTPALLAQAWVEPNGASDGGRGRDRRDDDERRATVTSDAGESGDDGRRIPTGGDPNKSRPIDPTSSAPQPSDSPPEGTDAAAPTAPSTPDGGGGSSPPVATETTPPVIPPGLQPATPPATVAPGGPPPVATPDNPSPTATPSPLPRASATVTASPTASPTPTPTPTATPTTGTGPTATPQPMPTVTPLAAPW